ncbi:MAG: Ubiquinone biosynthesis protein [Marteilia pararefringens]
MKSKTNCLSTAMSDFVSRMRKCLLIGNSMNFAKSCSNNLIHLQPRSLSSSSSSSKCNLDCIQRTLLALGSMSAALMNPTRDDMVACSMETFFPQRFYKVRDMMLESEEGRSILRDEPIVNKNSVDLTSLSKLSHNTFGYRYYEFMTENRFDMDQRPEVHFIKDPLLRYVITRYRQIHDFQHVLLDLPPTVIGELILKMFEYSQMKIVPAFLSGTLAYPIISTLRNKKLKRDNNYYTYLLPYAMNQARVAPFMMSIYFEKYFKEDIDEIRQQWSISPLNCV